MTDTVRADAYADFERIRIVNRASLRFFTSMLAMVTEASGTDAVDALILLLITSLNVAHLRENTSLNERHAGLDEPAPDEVRRPVPVSEIAELLRLPVLDANRRLEALAAGGSVARQGNGWIATYERRDPEAFARLSRTMLALARHYVHDLQRQGVKL